MPYWQPEIPFQADTSYIQCCCLFPSVTYKAHMSDTRDEKSVKCQRYILVTGILVAGNLVNERSVIKMCDSFMGAMVISSSEAASCVIILRVQFCVWCYIAHTRDHFWCFRVYMLRMFSPLLCALNNYITYMKTFLIFLIKDMNKTHSVT